MIANVTTVLALVALVLAIIEIVRGDRSLTTVAVILLSLAMLVGRVG